MTRNLIQDRYLIGPKISQGGMGTIFRGYDQFLKREVAIKVVTNPKLDETSHQKLVREARAAAKLNHPNIVSIYDAGYHQDNAFIIMELVEGEAISKENYQTLESIIHIATQICSALEHAHNLGIVHRDLKPDNVLMTAEGLIKLTDFGLARSTSSRLTSEGVIEGTIFYMAPEQALGRDVDHRTDLYSLGVLLYEMVTGQLPFVADEPLQVITQHLNTRVVPPRAHKPDIPPSLDKLILHLLKKRPDKRPDTAEQVKSALIQVSRHLQGGDIAEDIDPIRRIIHGQMVGRDYELREATRIWKRAAAGETHVLLINGEAGVGKTRFVQELETLVEVMGARVLATDCYAEGGAPYGPISHLIRVTLEHDPDLSKILPDFYLSYLRDTAPDLRSLIDEPYPDRAPNEGNKLEAFSESFVLFCSRLSDQDGLLLILEDTQWSDSGSLYLIRQLARRGRSLGLRILIVLTYRQEEVINSPHLKETIYELVREKLTSHLTLNRLTQGATVELLTAMLRGDFSSEFAENVFLETEGNPYFIEEVCKALIQSGDLHHDGEKWCCFDLERLKIPQSLRMAIEERINRLSDETRDTLLQAAILGHEFDFNTLLKMSDLDERTLINALEEAENALLIVELDADDERIRPVTQYTFSQKLIPSTLQESIGSLRRKEIHRRAAEALESSSPGNSEKYAKRIGNHLLIAGEAKKASEYYLIAADSAQRMFAYQESIDAYQQALALLKELEEHRLAAQTLMKLGLIYHTTFNFDLAREAYRDGFNLWQRAGAAADDAQLLTKQTLRTHWPNIITLDPAFANDTYSTGIINQLFRGLAELSSDLTILPDAAVSWDVLEEGKKYVFHLRDDMKWTDGQKVTASDFEFAWKRVLDPATGSDTASYLFDVSGARDFHQGVSNDADAVGVRALDDHTLIVDLERQTGSFLYQLSMPCTFAVPKHTVTEFGPAWTDIDNITTNGAFRIKDWKQSVRYTLSQNHNYRGEVQGNIDEIILMVQSKNLDLLQAYEDDEIDIFDLGALEPSEAHRVIQLHTDEYLSAPGPTTLYLGYNTFRPPFNDKMVRRSFSQAVDKEMLVDVITRMRGGPALGGFIPPGIPGHSEGIGLPYDPENARKLLSEAGYSQSNKFPEVRFLVPKSPGIERRANFLKAQWRENLSVNSSWEAVDLSDYLDGLAGEGSDIFMIAWLGSFPDPDDYLTPTMRKTFLLWDDEEYSALISEARHTADESRRIQLYQQADKRIIEEAAITPLSYGRHHLLHKPWVKRYPISPMRLCYWKNALLDPHGV